MRRKKLLSLILAFTMLVAISVIPQNIAWAKESNEMSKSGNHRMGEMIEQSDSRMGAVMYEAADMAVSKVNQLKVEALGAELFPQYAEKDGSVAMCAYTNTLSNGGLGDVVYSETKTVSENEQLTYVEYASGRASLLYQKSWSNTSTSTAVSGGTQYRRTLTVTASGCGGSVSVKGLTYTINPTSPDWIDNAGECIDNSGYTTITRHSMTESGSGAPARITYAGNVEDIKYHYTVGISFEVRVGGNLARVYVGNTEI